MTEATHTPTDRAMRAAVEMEIHASCSTTTQSKAQELDRRFPAYDDMLAVAKMPLVHQIEESEGIIRLSIAGVEVCAHPDGTPQATALLQFDAQQRAALSKAGLPQ